ncbi:MAG: ethylbenzene dehydrogenase-related protein [Candidatus Binatia bacterium]
MPKRLLPATLIFSAIWLLTSASQSFPQGVVLVSRLIEGELPLRDPNSRLWEKAHPLVVPLSSQVNFKPRIYNATVHSLKVKSLNNGKEIAFLLEWEDPSRDVSALKAESFTDAVAIQHPVSLENEKVWFCMGQPDAVVNIWHWRGDWQEDLQEAKDQQTQYPQMGWDYYPLEDDDTFYARKTAVEDLNAARMQTLTAQPMGEQDVNGFGAWDKGRWRVVISRDLRTPDKNDAQFQPTVETQKLRPIAFAVWDGGNSEAGARKAVSAFYFLDLSLSSAKGGFATIGLALALTVAVEAGGVWWFRRRRRNRG